MWHTWKQGCQGHAVYTKCLRTFQKKKRCKSPDGGVFGDSIKIFHGNKDLALKQIIGMKSNQFKQTAYGKLWWNACADSVSARYRTTSVVRYIAKIGRGKEELWSGLCSYQAMIKKGVLDILQIRNSCTTWHKNLSKGEICFSSFHCPTCGVSLGLFGKFVECSWTVNGWSGNPAWKS